MIHTRNSWTHVVHVDLFFLERAKCEETSSQERRHCFNMRTTSAFVFKSGKLGGKTIKIGCSEYVPLCHEAREHDTNSMKKQF